MRLGRVSGLSGWVSLAMRQICAALERLRERLVPGAVFECANVRRAVARAAGRVERGRVVPVGAVDHGRGRARPAGASRGRPGRPGRVSSRPARVARPRRARATRRRLPDRERQHRGRRDRQPARERGRGRPGRGADRRQRRIQCHCPRRQLDLPRLPQRHDRRRSGDRAIFTKVAGASEPSSYTFVPNSGFFSTEGARSRSPTVSPPLMLPGRLRPAHPPWTRREARPCIVPSPVSL